jgi:hypothetical protein
MHAASLKVLGTLLPAVALSLCLMGCAEPESEPFIESSSDNLSEVKFELPDTPSDLELGVTIEDSFGYGECERQAAPDEGYDLTYNCGPAWSEVAWYRLAADVVNDQLTTNASTLRVQFTVPQGEPLLRASIHRIDDDGGKTKLTSVQTLFDGDVIEAPLEQVAEYDVYVARGRSLAPIWGTGTAHFEMIASVE